MKCQHVNHAKIISKKLYNQQKTMTKTEINQSLERLSKLIKPGDTLYTILRHTSKSGMTRHIDVAIKGEMSPLYCISRETAALLDLRCNGSAVKVSGAGMDMGYHLVYNLAYTLFPNGFECIGEHCPSNDHMNGDMNYKQHIHRDGGYALRHEWI